MRLFGQNIRLAIFSAKIFNSFLDFFSVHNMVETLIFVCCTYITHARNEIKVLKKIAHKFNTYVKYKVSPLYYVNNNDNYN